MEEKTIIKSKKAHVKLTTLAILLVGVFVCSILSLMLSRIDGELDGELLYLSAIIETPIILIFATLACRFYAWSSKSALTFTNKRIYGKAAFGKQIDLPFDMIAAVGKGIFFKTIEITTSNVIKFPMIANNDDIFNAISKLLLERQDAKNSTEELKKYKDLLDSGVITQEEFDAKKKQLLGV